MKPFRARKHDRLTTPSASPEEIACDHAVAAFDRAALEAERTWGVDRLPALVSPETAAKFGRLVGLLNEALRANDAPKVAALTATAVRGWQAMDAEARRLGHEPLPAWMTMTDVDGHIFVILHDGADWRKPEVEALTGRGVEVYTMREISVALRLMRDAGSGAVGAFKAAFPGAEVTAHRPRKAAVYDDPIDLSAALPEEAF